MMTHELGNTKEDLKVRLEEVINEIGRGKLATMVDLGVRHYHNGLSTEGVDLGVDISYTEYVHGLITIKVYVFDNTLNVTLRNIDIDVETGDRYQSTEIGELVLESENGSQDYKDVYGELLEGTGIPQLLLRVEKVSLEGIYESKTNTKHLRKEVIEENKKVKKELSKYDGNLIIK